MQLLQNVEEPQSDIEDYVNNLDMILIKKMEMIGNMRKKLASFYGHLKKEENLQKLYTTKLSETGQSHEELQQLTQQSLYDMNDQGNNYQNVNGFNVNNGQDEMSHPGFDNFNSYPQESPLVNPADDENMLDDEGAYFMNDQGPHGHGRQPPINAGNYNNFFQANQ